MKWTRHAFIICWLISLISYIPSIGSGFVFDFVGWQRAYNAGSFADIINCFGYHGNHQFLHLLFYTFYKIFHIQGVPWYLLFCTLHAVNGFMLYKLIIKLSAHWKYNFPELLAIIAAVLFLINPYNVETVVAKVCLHYLITTLALLALLLLFIRYLGNPVKKTLLIAGAVYLASLFSLEISFVTPLIISFAGLLTYILSEQKKTIFKSTMLYAGMLWGMLGCYLILNKLTLGSVVGHYGSDVHLQLDILSMAATEFKYFVKHLIYARYFSFYAKAALFDKWLSFPEIAFLGICIVIALCIIYFILIRKLHPKWHLVFFGIITSFILILPVSNIFFTHLQVGMNDRYSYLPIALFTLSLMAFISNFPKWLIITLVSILFSLSLFFQQKTLSYWHISTKVLQSLKEDFRWHDAPYVFILNSPDNYKGIVMANIINEPTGIDELIDNQTSRPYNGVMYDIFQFNMTTPEDGVRVEQTGPMQLKVTFDQWGNWWHRNGVGAGSYENEYYKAEVLDYPYQVTFKQLPAGSVIIHQDGGEWKEFKMDAQ